VTFLVISFLREGDFTKMIVILGVAFVAGLMVLRFKDHVAARFATWGHIWELADSSGYQQTRMLTAASSGGLVGVGAGEGWFGNSVFAAQTDFVFGLITEEWGLIIAVLSVLAIITMAVFAYRSIWAGRSTFYTIAACAAASIFLFQTILNVLGSCDLIPLTGVTFPFLSAGGSSMISAWGLLAFLKGADTRQDASIAVKNVMKKDDMFTDRINSAAPEERRDTEDEEA
jgi:cell division protein FtsW (lipid II flippase)